MKAATFVTTTSHHAGFDWNTAQSQLERTKISNEVEIRGNGSRYSLEGYLKSYQEVVIGI